MIVPVHHPCAKDVPSDLSQGLSKYHRIALTPILMRYFERLVRRHIHITLPTSLDTMQFSYQPICSKDKGFEGYTLSCPLNFYPVNQTATLTGS